MPTPLTKPTNAAPAPTSTTAGRVRRDGDGGRGAPSISPRDAVVTLFGGYLRAVGNWIAIADMVVLLDVLGIDEQSARSTIARLKRSGLLDAARHHGAAGYSASTELLGILAEGDVRLFQSQIAADLADGWVLVIFSVPETERHRRHQLRSRLTGLGCGPLTAGVWMAPRRVSADVRRTLDRLDLAKYSWLFEGSHVGFADLQRAGDGRDDDRTDLRELVDRTWDIGQMSRHYAQFTARTERMLARWSRGPHDPRTAFVDFTRLLEDWRRLAYQDPGLPDEVSSCATERRASRELFATGVELLRPPAWAHVASVMGPRTLAPTTTPAAS